MITKFLCLNEAAVMGSAPQFRADMSTICADVASLSRSITAPEIEEPEKIPADVFARVDSLLVRLGGFVRAWGVVTEQVSLRSELCNLLSCMMLSERAPVAAAWSLLHWRWLCTWRLLDKYTNESNKIKRMKLAAILRARNLLK